MNPKISIITVCYNSEAHLEEAIQSVVSQPYENKEYIVIDGGSTDGTLAIIEKYRDKIDYFVSEKDKGISDAFNKGIKAATGDVIGICNADDVLAEDVLTKIAEAYEPDVEVYRLEEKIRNFETGEEFLLRPTISFSKSMLGAQPCHMGCYITKSAYEKYGVYDVNMRYLMDMELLRRFTYMGAKQKYVPKICGYFRKGGASQTNLKNRLKERAFIIKKYGGSNWDVFVSDVSTRIRQLAKRCITLFGEDAATRLKSNIKYGK